MKMPVFSSPNIPVSIRAILVSGTAALAAGLGVGAAVGRGVGVCSRVCAATDTAIVINPSAVKIKRVLFIAFLPNCAHEFSLTDYTDCAEKEKGDQRFLNSPRTPVTTPAVSVRASSTAVT